MLSFLPCFAMLLCTVCQGQSYRENTQVQYVCITKEPIMITKSGDEEISHGYNIEPAVHPTTFWSGYAAAPQSLNTQTNLIHTE